MAAYELRPENERLQIVRRFSEKHGRWPSRLSLPVYLEAKNIFARL